MSPSDVRIQRSRGKSGSGRRAHQEPDSLLKQRSFEKGPVPGKGVVTFGPPHGEDPCRLQPLLFTELPAVVPAALAGHLDGPRVARHGCDTRDFSAFICRKRTKLLSVYVILHKKKRSFLDTFFESLDNRP